MALSRQNANPYLISCFAGWRHHAIRVKQEEVTYLTRFLLADLPTAVTACFLFFPSFLSSPYDILSWFCPPDALGNKNRPVGSCISLQFTGEGGEGKGLLQLHRLVDVASAKYLTSDQHVTSRKKLQLLQAFGVR